MTRRDRRHMHFQAQHTRRPCKWCGVMFEPYKPEHEFHCKACNNAWHALERKRQNVYVPQAIRPKVAELVKELLATPEFRQIEAKPIFTQDDTAPEDDPDFRPSFYKPEGENKS